MNSGWKRFTRRTKNKVLSWLGGALACLFGALCCAGVFGAVEMGCYDAGVTSYYDTRDAGSLTSGVYAYNAWLWYQSRTPGKNTQYDLSGDFMFCLTDAKTGNKLYSNVDDPKAHLIGQYEILEDQEGEDSFYWSSTAKLKSAQAVKTFTEALTDPDVNSYTIMECYLPDAASATDEVLTTRIEIFDFLFAARSALIVGIVLCAVLGIFWSIALFCGAGRTLGDDDVHLCWYDRVPMELSLLVTAGLLMLTSLCGRAAYRPLYELLGGDSEAGLTLAGAIGGIAFYALLITAGVLFIGVWLLSFARWAKTGHAFQNCLCIRLAKGIVHAVGYSFGALPLVKKTALAVGTLALGSLIVSFLFFLLGERNWWGSLRTQLLFALYILVWAAVWYLCIRIARNLQTLRQATERIAAGDYETPVDTRELLPVFAEDAERLSHIGIGMNDAVVTRIKSERLKAELITNVSHDLKTPLTSIINYTDLLQREPLPEKAAEYAAVLSRQGEKLKKLTEDLIDASKASSGAMPCHKVKASLDELCEQALGEYQEKLAAARLEPVLSLPDAGLTAIFDGRLTWRVLDNLLSNACKYAMPGTRLYLTGERQGSEAVLSVKNISATPLNTSPDELMERFVRGDSSRTSEGSGLGLSIARSLTELQGGVFTLSVDGDLFKAEMRFTAQESSEQTAVPQA